MMRATPVPRALLLVCMAAAAVVHSDPTGSPPDAAAGQLVELLVPERSFDPHFRLWLSIAGPVQGTLQGALHPSRGRARSFRRSSGTAAAAGSTRVRIPVDVPHGDVMRRPDPSYGIPDHLRFESIEGSVYTPPKARVLCIAVLGRTAHRPFELSGPRERCVLHTRPDRLGRMLESDIRVAAVGLDQIGDLSMQGVADLIQFTVSGGVLVLVDNVAGPLPALPEALRGNMPDHLAETKTGLLPDSLDWLVAVESEEARAWPHRRQDGSIRPVRPPGADASAREWIPVHERPLGLGTVLYLAFDPYEGDSLPGLDEEDPLVTAIHPIVSARQGGWRLLQCCHRELERAAISDRFSARTLPGLPLGLPWPIPGVVALAMAAVLFAVPRSLRRRRRVGDVVYLLLLVSASAAMCLLLWALSRRQAGNEWKVIHGIAVPAPAVGTSYRQQIVVRWSALPIVERTSVAPVPSDTASASVPVTLTPRRRVTSSPFVPRFRSAWTSGAFDATLSGDVAIGEQRTLLGILRNHSERDFREVWLLYRPGAAGDPGPERSITMALHVGMLPAGKSRRFHAAGQPAEELARAGPSALLGERIVQQFAMVESMPVDEVWLLAVVEAPVTAIAVDAGHRLLLQRLVSPLRSPRGVGGPRGGLSPTYLSGPHLGWIWTEDTAHATAEPSLVRLHGVLGGSAADLGTEAVSRSRSRIGHLVIHDFYWMAPAAFGTEPPDNGAQPADAAEQPSGKDSSAAVVELSVSLFDMRRGEWVEAALVQWVPAHRRDDGALRDMVQRYRDWRAAAIASGSGFERPPTDVLTFEVEAPERFIDPSRREVLVRLRQTGRRRQPAFSGIGFSLESAIEPGESSAPRSDQP